MSTIVNSLRLFVALAAFAGGQAHAMSSAQAEKLITEYGKELLVELILDRRAGAITLALKQGHVERYGRPNPQYITAATLAEDLDKAGIDLAAAQAALAAKRARLSKQSERLTGAASDRIPLSGLDPKLRIRGERRSWTVKRLIADADKTKRGWPDWLNRLRKQQAYTRNRAIERVLRNMQSQYGSLDLSKASRTADKRHYDEVRTCRALPNRSRNPEYALRGCRETVSQPRPSTRLRKLLREPFTVFRKSMEPSIARFIAEQKLKVAY